MRQAIRNAIAQSRAAHGVMDLSASPLKRERIGSVPGGIDLARSTRERVVLAAEWAWGWRQEDLREIASSRTFVEGINGLLVSGDADGPAAYRTWPGTNQLPYAPVSAIPTLSESCYRLIAATSVCSGIETAAAAIWLIDLYGHLFRDACGKTGNLVAAWLLDQSGLRVPPLEDRSEVLGACYDHGSLSRVSWTSWLSTVVTEAQRE